MIKKTVRYMGIDDEPIEEELLFNLSKAELLELQVAYPEGYDKHLQKIVASGDQAAIYKEFKELIIRAYGQRSGDGKRLVKSPQAANEFASSEAFAEVIMSLATDEAAAAAFMTGLLPKDLNQTITAANAAAVQQAQTAQD